VLSVQGAAGFTGPVGATGATGPRGTNDVDSDSDYDCEGPVGEYTTNSTFSRQLTGWPLK